MARRDVRKKPKTDAPRRKSKRNNSSARPTPKNFEDMLKEAERLASESIYEEACARKPKHTGPPFRLLDLPPELRMRIFDYAMFRPYPLQLRNIVAPLITAVSKQVRAECMAGFFALNTFQMTVETNICLLHHIDSFSARFGSLRAARQRPFLAVNHRYWLDLIYRVEPRAGGLHITANSEDWITKIHRDVAVFRNIDVVLRDALDHPALCASNPRAPQGLELAWISNTRSLAGRNIFTVSTWHPKQLVPHYVSQPINARTTDDYLDRPGGEFLGALERSHPHFDTFNFTALKALAFVIGHWRTNY